MESPKRELGITLDRNAIRLLLEVGHQFDLNKDGSYDARSGAINIWCGPDDKPACWHKPITQGGLDYPRAYVGMLSWEFDEHCKNAKLYLEATPYDLGDKDWGDRFTNLSKENWDDIFNWLEQKARGLIRLANLHPQILGTKCPFCKYYLPSGNLLNDLLDHVVKEHDKKITAIVMGDPTHITVDNCDFALESFTEFDK